MVDGGQEALNEFLKQDVCQNVSSQTLAMLACQENLLCFFFSPLLTSSSSPHSTDVKSRDLRDDSVMTRARRHRPSSFTLQIFPLCRASQHLPHSHPRRKRGWASVKPNGSLNRAFNLHLAGPIPWPPRRDNRITMIESPVQPPFSRRPHRLESAALASGRTCARRHARAV